MSDRGRVCRPVMASTGSRQEFDFYMTDPVAAVGLLECEDLAPNIWECACGNGSLSKVFDSMGHNVRSTDLYENGYGDSGIDFLTGSFDKWDGDIVTNPPFSYAREFVERALELVDEGSKVVMFLRVQFLEGKSRKDLFENTPPIRIHISRSRIKCYKNGDVEAMKGRLVRPVLVGLYGRRDIKARLLLGGSID